MQVLDVRRCCVHLDFFALEYEGGYGDGYMCVYYMYGKRSLFMASDDTRCDSAVSCLWGGAFGEIARSRRNQDPEAPNRDNNNLLLLLSKSCVQP